MQHERRHSPTRVKTSLLLASFITAVLAIAACGPRGPETSGTSTARQGGATSAGIVVELTIDAPRVGTVAASARVTEDGEPVTGATVSLRGDMTHAGMAPSISALTEEGEGLYRTDAFQFQMAGDWIMSVEVSTPDGRKTSTETFVTVAAR